MDEDTLMKKMEMDMAGIVFNEQQKQSIESVTMMYLTAYYKTLETDADVVTAHTVATNCLVAMFRSNK